MAYWNSTLSSSAAAAADVIYRYGMGGEFNESIGNTLQRIKRHENLVSDIKKPGCALVTTLPGEERCAFVTDTRECNENQFIFNYIHFYYCVLNSADPASAALGICFLLMICLYLFMILGYAADSHFCPSLKVLSKLMGLNENVAGVTLLAFGNGAPDMFTSLASLAGASRQIYSDIFGAAIFVVFAISGFIIIVVPFTVQRSAFLRDICFLLLDILYIDYVMTSQNKIEVVESVFIIVIYIAFILVVLLDQQLVKRQARELERKQGRDEMTETDSLRLRALQSELDFDVLKRIRTHSIIYEESRFLVTPESQEPQNSLLQQFKYTLNPIDRDSWEENNCFWRFVQIIQIPYKFLLLLIVPIIDFELPLHGWSKLLNCLQIAIMPSIVVYGVVRNWGFNSVPLFIVICAMTIPIALYTFITTETNKIPIGHEYFSVMGIIGSVFVIYSLAAETISILEVLGITTGRSDAFLGCTILAWGNSIGDLVANISLARQGYYKMGLAACFGGPLFNSLVSIGTSFVYHSTHSPTLSFEMGEGTMGENSTVFLLIGLGGLLWASACTNFVLRRSIGMFLITMYVMFFTFTLLSELEIVHPYGSDHSMDLRAEDMDEF